MGNKILLTHAPKIMPDDADAAVFTVDPDLEKIHREQHIVTRRTKSGLVVQSIFRTEDLAEGARVLAVKTAEQTEKKNAKAAIAYTASNPAFNASSALEETWGASKAGGGVYGPSPFSSTAEPEELRLAWASTAGDNEMPREEFERLWPLVH